MSRIYTNNIMISPVTKEKPKMVVDMVKAPTYSKTTNTTKEHGSITQ